MIKGQPDKVCKVGDYFQVAAGVPHSVQVGPHGAAMIWTYVILKGQSLASDA